jgi:outer membrane biosynthesis protein TonB
VNQSSDDRRRELEKTALRSVRNLVDEIEAEDRNRSARALKSLLWIGPFVIVGLAAAAFLLSSAKPRNEVALNPPGQVRLSQEAFDKSRASYLAGPRKKFVGATMEPRFQTYVDNCLAKILRVANSSHRSEMATISGQAQLTIAVRFDGIIEGVVANKTSGHEAIEPTAKRVVRMADTCGAFPEEIRRDTDVLSITRTFTIAGAALAPEP